MRKGWLVVALMVVLSLGIQGFSQKDSTFIDSKSEAEKYSNWDDFQQGWSFHETKYMSPFEGFEETTIRASGPPITLLDQVTVISDTDLYSIVGDFLTNNHEVFKLNPDDISVEFKNEYERTTDDGFKTFTYNLYRNGYQVEGGHIVVELDNKKNIVSLVFSNIPNPLQSEIENFNLEEGAMIVNDMLRVENDFNHPGRFIFSSALHRPVFRYNVFLPSRKDISIVDQGKQFSASSPEGQYVIYLDGVSGNVLQITGTESM